MTATLQKSPAVCAGALAIAEAGLLAPLRSAFSLPPEVRAAVYEAGAPLADASARLGSLSASAARGAADRARLVLRHLPPRQELEAAAAAAADALDEQPDSNRARMLIGLLLDSFPAGRPADLRRYADALLFDVVDLGFPPAVVARGCQIVRRTSEFLPTSAKLIAACEQAQTELKGVASSQRRLAGYVAAAETVVQLLEDQA